MSPRAPVLCPACRAELTPPVNGSASCAACGAGYAERDGVLDLGGGAAAADCAPVSAPELCRALARLAAGSSYRETFEQLLLELDDDGSDAVQLFGKESRAAWWLVLGETGKEALLFGNALSGSVPPLAARFRLTVVEPSLARLRFARARLAAECSAESVRLIASAGPRLPFPDRAFDLVACEEPLAPRSDAGHAGLDELERVTRGELLLCADNRLAYKRSSGRRGVYHVPGPLEALARFARPTHGARTLRGHRSILARGFASTRAFALYPDARDFSHVVGLDGGGPHLTIGPRERANLVKRSGHALGLFPVFTPSFALVAARAAGRGPAHVERVLAALAERLAEPAQTLDIFVTTRSNCALIHTAPRAQEAARGGWTLHVPMNPRKREMIAEHHRFLGLVRRRHPDVPVPEPLFIGELEGTWFVAERRLPGLSAQHLTGHLAATRTMLLDVSRHLANLVVVPRVRLDEGLFDELFDSRFRIARDHAGVAATRRNVDRLRDATRERVLGRELPLVLQHADLRAKHIQVGPRGGVLGYLDWGASEERFLPWVDFLHLLVHQRKQERQSSAELAWRPFVDGRGLAPHEHEALEDHARRMPVDGEVRAALERALPVLIAGMAELHWEYSRPRWLHRQFGL